MRIGLLGGSFNPAHAGHLHVARLARKRLRLHQVWLLVSPGNPLKSGQEMAPLAARLASAAAIADGRRIIATDLEQHLGTRYTADTLTKLRRRFPRVRFVWLMGADNLLQLPRWQRWLRIVHTMPFAVLPRPSYTRAALAGPAAQRLRQARRRGAGLLAETMPPAWALLPARQHPASASSLRAAARDDSDGTAPPHRTNAAAPAITARAADEKDNRRTPRGKAARPPTGLLRNATRPNKIGTAADPIGRGAAPRGGD